MTSSTRNVLFVLWLVLIALANLGYAYSANPLIATAILGLVGFPFRRAGELTRPVSRRETVVGLCTAGVLVALLIASALSGFSKASNAWFDRSGFHFWFAIGGWILLSVMGWKAFRAGRFLAPRG